MNKIMNKFCSFLMGIIFGISITSLTNHTFKTYTKWELVDCFATSKLTGDIRKAQCQTRTCVETGEIELKELGQ